MCTNRDCVGRHLASYYRALERSTDGTFGGMETELNRRMNSERFGGRTNRAPDGNLDLDEVDFVIRRSGASSVWVSHDSMRRQVFREIDLNHDGRVSPEELRSVVARYGRTARTRRPAPR